MIANISPSSLYYEETHNTLKYANRAKNIKTKVEQNVINVEHHVAQYPRIIKELQAELEAVKEELLHQKSIGVVPAIAASIPPLEEDPAENEAIYHELIRRIRKLYDKIESKELDQVEVDHTVEQNEHSIAFMRNLLNFLPSESNKKSSTFFDQYRNSILKAIDHLQEVNVGLRHNAGEYAVAIARHRASIDRSLVSGPGAKKLSQHWRDRLMAEAKTMSMSAENLRMCASYKLTRDAMDEYQRWLADKMTSAQAKVMIGVFDSIIRAKGRQDEDELKKLSEMLEASISVLSEITGASTIPSDLMLKSVLDSGVAMDIISETNSVELLSGVALNYDTASDTESEAGDFAEESGNEADGSDDEGVLAAWRATNFVLKGATSDEEARKEDMDEKTPMRTPKLKSLRLSSTARSLRRASMAHSDDEIDEADLSLTARRLRFSLTGSRRRSGTPTQRRKTTDRASLSTLSETSSAAELEVDDEATPLAKPRAVNLISNQLPIPQPSFTEATQQSAKLKSLSTTPEIKETPQNSTPPKYTPVCSAASSPFHFSSRLPIASPRPGHGPRQSLIPVMRNTTPQKPMYPTSIRLPMPNQAVSHNANVSIGSPLTKTVTTAAKSDETSLELPRALRNKRSHLQPPATKIASPLRHAIKAPSSKIDMATLASVPIDPAALIMSVVAPPKRGRPKKTSNTATLATSKKSRYAPDGFVSDASWVTDEEGGHSEAGMQSKTPPGPSTPGRVVTRSARRTTKSAAPGAVVAAVEPAKKRTPTLRKAVSCAALVEPSSVKAAPAASTLRKSAAVAAATSRVLTNENTPPASVVTSSRLLRTKGLNDSQSTLTKKGSFDLGSISGRKVAKTTIPSSNTAIAPAAEPPALIRKSSRRKL
jgi:hypothetical protein